MRVPRKRSTRSGDVGAVGSDEADDPASGTQMSAFSYVLDKFYYKKLDLE
jgi:hypothetical protein